MTITIEIVDESDAKEILDRIASKESIIWNAGLLIEKECQIRVDAQNKTIKVFKSKTINHPIRL